MMAEGTEEGMLMEGRGKLNDEIEGVRNVEDVEMRVLRCNL